jgi:polyisoprenoid-binding protein YceI
MLAEASYQVDACASLIRSGLEQPLNRKELQPVKRLAIVAFVLALAAPLALAQNTTWVSDPNHSEVGFAINHMSISKVHGRFGNVNATIQLNAADITKSTVQVTIGVDTIDTGVQGRDNDLKSANYFDVASFPTATFASTSVTRNGDDLSIAGNLTLYGVTKPVVLTVVGPTAQVTDQRNRVHCGFSATATISRTDFGIGAKVPPAMVGDAVKLTIEVDAVKQ